MSETDESLALKNAFASAAALGRADQERLYRLLKESLYPASASLDSVAKEVRERRFKDGITCPHCTSAKTHLNGKAKGKQRYVCKDCQRSFGDFTNSPVSRTKYPELWMKHLQLMVEGATLKRVSQELDIHISTAFFWRHKVLNGLKDLPLELLNGVAEVDETYFLESQKGKHKYRISHRKPRKRGEPSKLRGISREQVCVLVGRDREKHTIAKVVGMGQMTNKRAESNLSAGFGEVTALCTDSAGAYRNYARNHEIHHYALNTSKKVRVLKGIYHIQNVNAYHSRLKKWMDRFCGVSTKHMNNYLAWFHFVDDHGTQALRPKVMELLVSSAQQAVAQTYKMIKMTTLNLSA